MKEKTLYTSSPQQTLALARRFASLLHGGEIVFLRGPIGAGKTVFVKGVAEALGMKSSPTSASFSLMKRYQKGKHTLYHIDLFRLTEGEVFNLGFEEMLEDEQAVILAEWPDPLAQMMPQDRLEMDFVLEGGDKRRITLRAGGAVSRALAEDLCR
ncbi:MAG TPA: tRNA (adenosine(37)-N6)-threonylcarbamoyltransferase complex ATPase subunit type 1 TsaE [Candidatus Avelusimicrobium excrementipullorum]|nr:tRNA (adenosine(37)-N6)-threonylcarbamoyltransferase complex ATPase subunit type 1 TsaE [Candidatus Avelusimicrobium excrementipullorum]